MKNQKRKLKSSQFKHPIWYTFKYLRSVLEFMKHGFKITAMLLDALFLDKDESYFELLEFYQKDSAFYNMSGLLRTVKHDWDF